jgi:hypothetical protein
LNWKLIPCRFNPHLSWISRHPSFANPYPNAPPCALLYRAHIIPHHMIWYHPMSYHTIPYHIYLLYIYNMHVYIMMLNLYESCWLMVHRVVT